MGDAFLMLSHTQVQDLLATSTTKIEDSVTIAKSKLGDIREEMQQLKIDLYARFGKSINLET